MFDCLRRNIKRNIAMAVTMMFSAYLFHVLIRETEEYEAEAHHKVLAICMRLDTHISEKKYAEAYHDLMKDQEMLTKHYELLFRLSIISFHLGKHFDEFAMHLPKEASSATYFRVAEKALAKTISLNPEYDDYVPLLKKSLEEAVGNEDGFVVVAPSP